MNKYQWLETGTTKPVYTVMAKTEKQAIKKLGNYLAKIGKSGVACRENRRANKLQEENVSTTTLLGKTIQEKNELQMRVDAAFRVLSQLNALDDEAHKRWKREACMFSQGESNAYERAVRLLEQALKGGIK